MPLQFGVDIILKNEPNWKQNRIAILTNDAAKTNTGIISRLALKNAGFNLFKIFSPEHGITTIGEDGAKMHDGLDEITLATTTSVLSIGSGEISSDRIDPLDFDIQRAPISALVGGDAIENARITTAIFAGEKGAPRDAVVLNAAAAIAAYDARFELNLHNRMALGISRAIEAIDSGSATRLVAKWAELTQKLGA